MMPVTKAHSANPPQRAPKFISRANVRLRDLRKLLNDEPKVARAAISKHVQTITWAPERRAYIASGEFDLLGMNAVAVIMVPGARSVHNSPRTAFQVEIAA